MSGGARDRVSAPQHAADDANAEPASDLDAATSRRSKRSAAADFRGHLEPNAPQPSTSPEAALRTGSIGAMAAAFLAAGDFAGEMFLTQVRERFGPRVADRVRDVAFDGPPAIAVAAMERASPLSFGEAMQTKAPAPRGPIEPPSIGQSRAPDPLGQSRPLATDGQSFAASRDRDGDGHADLLTTPDANAATQRNTDARQLVAAVEQAIAHAETIATTLLPTYAAALDALDAAAVADAAADVIGTYTSAAQVRGKLRVQLERDDSAPDDRATLTPLGGVLGTALASAEALLASGLGVQRFHGRAVMPGVAPIHLPASPRAAAQRLTHEAGAAQGLIVAVHEIAALVPAGNANAAKANGSAAAEKVRIWSGRPVHFAFLKAALSELGIWSQIEHANIPGEIRSLGQLDEDVGRDAARFGAMSDVGRYDAGMAGALLVADKPSREDVVAVLDAINSAAPDARGPILEDLHRRGLLQKFAARLKYDEAEGLHDSASSGGAARAVLRERYGENPNTGDTTISTGSGTWLVSPLVALTRDKVPLVGKAYRFALNVGTFGFTEEHDAAHRAMQSGELSEDEYVDASNHALARSVAVGAVSTATGGAASSYVEGLTASVAARGAAGRIASTTATGIAGGAAGGAGARLGSDLVDGQLSGADEYASDAAMGGAIGGGIGFGASSLTAAAKYVPEHLKTPIHRLVSRLPSIADDSEVFAAIRALGERHSQGLATFTATTSHLAELAANRVATIAPEVWQAIDRAGAKLGQLGDGLGPQLATANGAPAGSSSTAPRYRFTAKAARPLHAPGDDAGALLHIQKAERLGDDADDFAGAAGHTEPSHGSLFDDYGEGANYADDVSDWHGDAARLDEDEVAGIGLAEPDGERLGRRVRHVDEQALPEQLAGERGVSPLSDVRLGITRDPRHHVLPQEEIAFFQARGFPGRDIDNFTIELPTVDHEMLHGGNQGLARVHWKEREWNTALMQRLRSEEAIKVAQVRRRLQRQPIPAKDAAALAAEQGKLTREEILDLAKKQMTAYDVEPSRFPFIPYHAP